MKSNKNFLYLTGGLGNQLFQLGAALYFSKTTPIAIESNLGSPRLNSAQVPDLFEFALPKNVEILRNKKIGAFFQKTAGYLLRSGIEPRGFEKNLAYIKLLQSLGSFTLSIYLKYPIRVKVSTKVGYQDFGDCGRNNFYIGYFQTYRWLLDEGVMTALKNIRLKNTSARVVEYIELAKQDKPLIVHVRQGDYRNEKSFGLVGEKYYLDSISEIWSQNRCNKIWVFSDEIESAQKLLSLLPDFPVKYISDPEISTAETLEIMRHGYAYVIANSTFSWWAASLSYSLDKTVVHPEPWFKGSQTPNELNPSDWIPRDPRFDN